MHFKNWLLSEMPAQIGFMGDWSPTAKRYGFDKKSIALLTSPKALQKIVNTWTKTPQDFEFYFVRSKDAYKYREIGEVTPDWILQNLKIEFQPKTDAITVLFTNNVGDEKMPMTGWTIGHRLGHAIRLNENFQKYFSEEIERDFRELLREIYRYSKKSYSDDFRLDQLQLRALAQAIGTMKSARDRKLRTAFEFNYELVAQYLTTGKIRFNKLPRFLITKNTQYYGRPNPQGRNTHLDSEALQEWDEILDGYAGKYEHHLDSILNGLIGKVFVM